MLRPYKLALLAYGLFLCRNGAAARSLAGARVGMRALTAHRQIPAVANAAISLNFNQAADVHLDLFAEIAFYPAFLLDGLANVIDFLFGEVANLLGVIHASFRRQLFRALPPDAIDRGQANPQPLLNRKINTCYTCHATCLLKFLKIRLSLALLVLRIGANYAHHASAMNYLALVANLFYRCPNFHNSLLLSRLQSGQPEGRPTCSGRRCGRALNRTAKAPRLLCLPREYE